jgi:hypothetical protein
VAEIINKHTLRLYSSADPGFEIPVFSKTRAQNHFESISSFLHFSNQQV